MKLNDSNIRNLAQNIFEHDYLLSDEVVEFANLRTCIDNYSRKIDELVNFYAEVQEYAFDVMHGDLVVFYDLLNNNYAKFIDIIEIMRHVNSIEEMQNNLNSLIAFIENAFADTYLKANLVKYAENIQSHVECIKLHQTALINLKNEGSGNG